MRIEAYTQVQQVYNTTKSSKSIKTNTAGYRDAVQISSMGKDIQIAKQAVANTPDIREEVVAPLKASVQAGTYYVSNESFADKLLEQYKETLAL
ncbi:MAG: flagellar biosynthesis anti-sigma factor FlgM [Lachnospiraceae bacterium]|nr:flagellar biosynthesis anti-sigma factor FlgM [Lachnospiraceae bacterium]